MTYKINLANIFSRLVNRFKLTLLGPISEAPIPILNSEIQPVTVIDNLLQCINRAIESVNVTATGEFTAFTVPPNKRWTIKSMFINPGNNAGVIEIGDTSLGTEVRFSEYAANTGKELTNINIPLDPTDTIDIQCNIYTAGTCTVEIMYIEEDAY